MKLPKAQPENIPPELQRGARFCLWRYETVDGRENCKIPYNAATGGRAQTNNLETFSEFPAVLDAAAAAPGQYDGIGLGLFGDLAAVDIDHCIDDAGNISALALDIIETMDSYTERSPSGQGIRIIFAAPGISRYMDKEDYEQQYYFRSSPAAPGVEIYIAGMTNRYVTITGDTIRTQTIEDRTRNAYTVLKKYMKRKQPQPQQIQQAPALVDLSDFDIIGRAKAAKNGAEFSALWAGDYAAYPSQSEADFALCSMLAFWTGRDAARIDSLFRQSGLFRDKWEKRSKYRQQTINKAIENCREVYTPPAERPQRAQERPQPVKSVNIPADTQTPQPAADGSEPPQEPLQGLLTVESAAAILDSVDSNFLEIKAFPQLSAMLKIRTHDTIVMAGDTGAGKSSLALNFLYGLQDRYPAMYINLEMDAATVLQRLVAIHTGIQLDEIEGYKHDSNTRSRVNASLQEITGRKDLQLINDLYNIRDIEKQIQTATQGREDPTIVFIDTGLLVTTPSRSGSRYERFTEISEELRRISRLYNIVMFVLLQQSRAGKQEEKQPTNSSLKESGSWENDATKVFFLWQNQAKEKEIVITKNRSGKTGNFTLDYMPHTQTYKEAKEKKRSAARFREIPDDEDPDNPFI